MATARPLSRSEAVGELRRLWKSFETLKSKLDAADWDNEKLVWRRGREPISPAGTLEAWFEEEVDMRRLARWIEFNTESGPDRRRRFQKVFSNLFDEACNVETQCITRDPFRWSRESRGQAAIAVRDEIGAVGEYLCALVKMLSRREGPPVILQAAADGCGGALESKRDMPPVVTIDMDGTCRGENWSIHLEENEAKVIRAVAARGSASLKQLRNDTDIDDAPRVLKRVREKHPQLAEQITPPGGRGKGGYRTTIIVAPQSATIG